MSKIIDSESPDISRFQWISLDETEELINTDKDLIDGLKNLPKSLPCRYLYDDRGSELFEQITELPEYYPTRTERHLLERYAPEIVQLTGNCDLIEFGSGSSSKTRILIEAYSQIDQQLHYCPIDVSAGILKDTALALLDRYPQLRLSGIAGTYERALDRIASAMPNLLPHAESENRLLIFLGSTLGNFNPQECHQFLTKIQQSIKPGEFFLLGVDLQKPIDIIESAYNDSQGITAEFNLNILRHLNHRYRANFDLEQFAHHAFYNTNKHQIEMHLLCLSDLEVRLEDIDLCVNFKPGETINTEISRKFYLPTLAKTLEDIALKPLQVWTDDRDWFGLILCQRQCMNGECP